MRSFIRIGLSEYSGAIRSQLFVRVFEDGYDDRL